MTSIDHTGPAGPPPSLSGATLPAADAATTRSPAARSAAYWAVLALAAVCVLVRPVVDGLGLPGALRNADALLTPPAVAVVLLLVLRDRRQLLRVELALALAVVGLGAVGLLSWALASPRSLVSFALTYSTLLLLPLGLLLAGLAARRRGGAGDLALLRAIVLLQLAVGLVQYVVLDVAQNAPYTADLVDGTTSHNFWPAIALPAAAAIVVLDTGWARWLWPLAVTTLAVYAEAKAALIVYLPMLLVLVLVAAAGPARAAWRRRRRSGRPAWRTVADGAVGMLAAAALAVGFFWSPSVHGTWEVFVGHVEEGVAVIDDPSQADNAITYHESLRELATAVPASARSLLLGLGPGNSVSHEAEILVQGTGGSASAGAGPVATRLLSDEGSLQFEDAQSTVLGVYGDLGVVGSLGYLLVLVLACGCLCGSPRTWWRGDRLRTFVLVGTAVGMLVGAVPLDWPEQASIVLPLLLVLVAVARGRDAAHPSADSDHRPGAVEFPR